ncbi:family 3 glycosyl hydrolase [Rathayibacter sp. VKM Ac-2801]|nr:family 3 glycosyl hydrolase [Rathayibacter sp. VKM Ac-2801]
MTSTTATTDFDHAVGRVREGAEPAEVARELLDELTREERLFLLDGDDEFWDGMREMITRGYNRTPLTMGRIARLGIPGFRFSDGPRGVVMGRSTAFPVPMARGATWDLALEERIGVAIGAEMRAQGANFFGGVCINVPRHPAWGRAQETYGEDSYLLGEFGASLTSGVRRHAMVVAKHYALNSMEDARFTVDVTADAATLREVYLPHFRRAVEAGVDGMMTSYNSVNGEWAGENEELMEGILRNSWQFEGVTVSDFIWGLRDPAKSLRAGLDIEEPFRQQRAEKLPDDLAAGRASWNDVDRSALRILTTQLVFHARVLADEPDPSVVFSEEHRALSREAAAEAAVLLKNEAVNGAPVLPLDASQLQRVALIGRLADIPNTGDKGSSNVRSPEVVTPLQGIRTALPGVDVVHVADDDPEAAAEAAEAADVAVVVVGYTYADEGESLGSSRPELMALYPEPPEGVSMQSILNDDDNSTRIVMGEARGGDRSSLRVRPIDADIIRATAAVNPSTVVVLITAGAVITEEWRDSVPAVLVSWYNGSEGGAALADVLLGVHDTTGRLPYSIPTSEAHLPYFDKDATAITYDRWHGQRLLDRDGVAAAFPLGFGLSYTDFSITAVRVSAVEDEHFTATATVTNTGARPGRHVVQLYAVIDADDFPRRVLVGFEPVWLNAGQSEVVTVACSTRPTQRWTDAGFVPAALSVVIEAAAFSGDQNAATTSLDLI